MTPSQAKKRWEGLCDPSKGCGVACCYHAESPCEHLDVTTQRCQIYPVRFGLRRTVSGEPFRCAPMKEFLQHRPAPTGCGYQAVTAIDGVPVVRGQA